MLDEIKWKTMREHKGLNGDLDHLPVLTSIMSLKVLGDLELQREREATFAGKKSKPTIEAPSSPCPSPLFD